MIDRRNFLAASLALIASQNFAATVVDQHINRRAIPSSGEPLPVIGMGSSRTFDVQATPQNLLQLTEVLKLFFAAGGSLIDSSPMYGRAEEILGQTLRALPEPEQLFAATKVWTWGQQQGIEQMKASSEKMGVPVFDLMQIHNLRDWKVHLNTLKNWKDEGKIRYIGVTTSHGRNHEDLLEIMASEPLDFVQLSYNIVDRDAENRLLPMAQDRGIATLINRPFQRGNLFKAVKGKPLPELGKELGCKSWGQYFLKFTLAHPAVTCLIPATSKVHHMEDNMGAGYGVLPDAKQGKEMLKAFTAL